METFKTNEKVHVWFNDESHKGVFVARENDMITVDIPGIGQVKVDHRDVLSELEYGQYLGELEDALSFRDYRNKLAYTGKCSRRCCHFGGAGGCLWLRDGEDFCGNYESRVEY